MLRFRGLTTALLAGVAVLPGMAVPAAPATSERKATIFYTGGVEGVLEPCGCTSDPLGDIARVTGVIRRSQAQTGAVLLVDAGNLLYGPGQIPERRRTAADLRAAFLAAEMVKLPFGGAGLGQGDLARGADKVAPRRLAANLAAAPFTEPSRLTVVGGIKIGVMGLCDSAEVRPLGLKAEDPAEVAGREARRLREAGAEIVIALIPMGRPEARRIARAGGTDFIILGSEVGDGLARADQVGSTFIVAPGAELQRLGRVEVVLRSDGRGPGAAGLVDAGGEAATETRRHELTRAIETLDRDLARWAKDATADAAFIAGKRRERDELAAEKARLAGGTWVPPATGSYFTNQLIPMSRALPRDPKLQMSMRRLDQAVGKANLATALPPAPAEPGRAAYVGDQSCARCHKAAAAFWKTTVHAHAWKTLVDGGKAADYECVSCHVTGYGEIGGSSLGHTKKLESIQCESCHGPASLHVAEGGADEPLTLHTATPESTCVRCHNQKHSDTFDYRAYLRDILGAGHGAEARKKLGPGPTGGELRRAAMARAKAAGEALARKM